MPPETAPAPLPATTNTKTPWRLSLFTNTCCSTTAVAKPGETKPLLERVEGGAAELEVELTAIEAQLKAAGEKYGGELLGAMGTVIKVLQAGDAELQILINTLNAIDKADPEVAAKLDPAIAIMQLVDTALQAIVAMMGAGTNLVKGAGQTGDAALQGNTTATLADAQSLVPNIVNVIAAAKALGAKNADGSPLDPQAIGTQVSEALTVAQQKNAKFTPIITTGAAALVTGAQAVAAATVPQAVPLS